METRETLSGERHARQIDGLDSLQRQDLIIWEERQEPLHVVEVREIENPKYEPGSHEVDVVGPRGGEYTIQPRPHGWRGYRLAYNGQRIWGIRKVMSLDDRPVREGRDILQNHVNELAIGPQDIDSERLEQLHARIESVADEIERLKE